MALMKCPECGNNVSDQAEKCPKCGYELKGNGENTVEKNDENKPKRKVDYKYIILGLLVLVVGLFIINQTRENNKKTESQVQTSSTVQSDQPQTTPGTNTGYVVYNDKNVGMQYEIPNNFKIMTDNNGLTYIGKNASDSSMSVPYILLCRDENYNNPIQYLNAFTDELRKNYSDVQITIEPLTAQIGNYQVYGIQYTYTSNGIKIVDDRYVTIIDNKVLMIGSVEQNSNSEDINNIIRVMFNTLKEGN